MVIAVKSPVKVYNARYPDSVVGTVFGLCWWRLPEDLSFFVQYKGQIICRWGGEKVIQHVQKPYERGPGAGGL